MTAVHANDFVVPWHQLLLVGVVLLFPSLILSQLHLFAPFFSFLDFFRNLDAS